MAIRSCLLRINSSNDRVAVEAPLTALARRIGDPPLFEYSYTTRIRPCALMNTLPTTELVSLDCWQRVMSHRGNLASASSPRFQLSIPR
ncbi:hypothetical protein AN403_5557 [Pseudomonas fluorescens]|uniref:Uncharacterized protein n=1 Tax=Pseudomonas fluorescens TaxID=294 RepID=A0A0P8ZUX0_PSEFL|nr:hypothetical protein AN403_5557 [Pseudomonas fluorescens]